MIWLPRTHQLSWSNPICDRFGARLKFWPIHSNVIRSIVDHYTHFTLRCETPLSPDAINNNPIDGAVVAQCVTHWTNDWKFVTLNPNMAKLLLLGP